MTKERLDLLAYSAILSAGLVEKSFPSIEWNLCCRTKNLADFAIPFRRHCSFLRSACAATRIEPGASHFVSFVQRSSSLQRFPLRSDPQRNAIRQFGFGVHQAWPGP